MYKSMAHASLTLHTAQASASSIAVAAASVRKPAALMLAIRNWHQLQQEHAATNAELRQLVIEHRNCDPGSRARRESQMQRVGDLATRLASEAGARLRDIERHRQPYRDAMRAALRPHRVAAAQQALHGIDIVEESLGLLDGADRELTGTGAEPEHWTLVASHLAGLRGRLARIV